MSETETTTEALSDHAPPTTPRPHGFERLRQRPERTASVTLAFDPNDAERLADLRRAKNRADGALDRLETAAAKDPARAGDLEQAAADAQAAAGALAAFEASIVTFTIDLRAAGSARVEALMLEHRPTDKQKRNAKALNNGDPKAQPQFNEDTFPPALLAEEIVAIRFSDGDVIDHIDEQQLGELWRGRWPQGDKLMVLQAALLINQATSSVGDLGKG